MANLVTLTIDDKHVSVPVGTLVVDAAKSAGIDIPIFCSHTKLDPVGACRMCLVEFVGPRGSRLDTSCTIPVQEGMVVRTNTPEVKAAREAVLGFILINHPLDCPICDKGGECPLQDQTMEYGPGLSQFVEPKRLKKKHYPISDLIMLDQERCVLCWRCTRYLVEWEDKPQLGLFKRGDRTIIDVFPGQPVDAKSSGNIIDICPVGALTDRTARFQYRPWQLRETPSVCNHCPVGCNVRLDERAHDLRRVVARENMAVNDQWICDKGRFVYQFVDHDQRLRTPLVRENGELRPATWEEALNRTAERLGQIAEHSGPQAIGGIALDRTSNEALYLFQKFFRVLVGNNNVDFPTGSAVRAQAAGLPALADIGKSDLIVLVGLDASEAAPIVDLFIKRAVQRAGAQLLIVNPRAVELTRYAGAHLLTRPGTEAIALRGLLASALTRRPAADARRGAIPAGGRPGGNGQAEGQDYTPQRIQQETGVPLATLGAAADLLSAAKNPLFIYGPDAARGERGEATVGALLDLAQHLGFGERVAYIGREANSQGARDMGVLPNALPGHLAVADAAVRERLGRLWGVQPPAEPGFSYDNMVYGGAVRALLVMGANPAAETAAAEALRNLDFLVVQELFMTETARLADVVFPATSFAESDGTYTNLERRVQRAPSAIRKAGESLPDWQILTLLAERWLEARQPELAAEAVSEVDRRKKRRARAAGGPAARPWHYGSAQMVLEEITKAVPIYANMRWESLGTQGLQWQASAVARPGRRTEQPIVQTSGPAPDGSFWLVGGPLLWDGGTLMQYAAPQVQRLIPPSFVALHPDDLAACGLPAGSLVTLSSGRAQVNLLLKSDASVLPGTAWVPEGLMGLPAEVLGAGRGDPVAVTIKASDELIVPSS